VNLTASLVRRWRARIGTPVIVDNNPAWIGVLEAVSDAGWATVRQGRRVDEVQMQRLQEQEPV
jgi:hypothetical protein